MFIEVRRMHLELTARGDREQINHDQVTFQALWFNVRLSAELAERIIACCRDYGFQFSTSSM